MGRLSGVSWGEVRVQRHWYRLDGGLAGWRWYRLKTRAPPAIGGSGYRREGGRGRPADKGLVEGRQHRVGEGAGYGPRPTSAAGVRWVLGWEHGVQSAISHTNLPHHPLMPPPDMAGSAVRLASYWPQPRASSTVTNCCFSRSCSAAAAASKLEPPLRRLDERGVECGQ